mmetsp:Transcript_27145/g.69054  ORF Transcript_27145/g.69054 Transcript_27145/m.69054 type:complete len:292 (-) Transcript_27145:587-1462(-)
MRWPLRPTMLMMWPHCPRRRMSCSTALVAMAVPSTLVLSISTQLATLPSSSDASLRDRPALFTSTCTPPASGQRLATMRGSVATSASLVMSHTTGRKCEGGTPMPCMCACSASSLSLRRATATTRRPFCASASHVAHPMPEDAPVTSATLPPHRSRPGCTALAGRGCGDAGAEPCAGACTTAAAADGLGAGAGAGAAGVGSGSTGAAAAATGAAVCGAGASGSGTGAGMASDSAGAGWSAAPGRAMSGRGASSMMTDSGTCPGSGSIPAAQRAAMLLSLPTASSRLSLMIR